MAKTPKDIDVRQHKETGRYYDGNRYATDEEASAALQRGRAWWWIGYFGYDEPNEAEEDVIAPDKSEASAVLRAALDRDFEPGYRHVRMVMA